jgi:hypothetical protein
MHRPVITCADCGVPVADDDFIHRADREDEDTLCPSCYEADEAAGTRRRCPDCGDLAPAADVNRYDCCRPCHQEAIAQERDDRRSYNRYHG